jgi:exodeoxyribonuclease VII large subunit
MYYPVFAQQLLNEHTKSLQHYQTVLIELIQKKTENVLREKEHLFSRLSSANPLHRLKQGYGISRVNHTLIRSVSQVQTGDILETDVEDGRIYSKIL